MKNKTLTKRAKRFFEICLDKNGELDAKKVITVAEVIKQSDTSGKLKLLQAFKAYIVRAHAKQTLIIETPIDLDQTIIDQVVGAMTGLIGRPLSPAVIQKPELISGVRVIWYDTIYDYSLQGKFEQMRGKVG